MHMQTHALPMLRVILYILRMYFSFLINIKFRVVVGFSDQDLSNALADLCIASNSLAKQSAR